MKLIPTILCGGAGSRLWPVSREMHPKPFMRVDGGMSLLQATYRRAVELPGVAEVLTVTNRELYFQIQDEYRKLEDEGRARAYILETAGRNTAPAIAAAALHVARIHGDDAMLLVLPADHVVSDQQAFAAAVTQAVRLAQSGRIVTFGIRPTAAETAYGYIEFDGDRVLGFVEKPPLEQARAYAASGRHLWNAGMFCFTAGAMQREMRKHCPAILAGVAECLQRSRTSDDGGEKSLVLDSERFGQLPSISVDYAVMEKSAEIAVVPCGFGWSDVGSWDALGALVKPDAHGNRVEGEALLHDVSNCYIRSEGRLVGAVGVDNLVVIDTPDALLVAARSRAQDVKNIYAQLKASGHESHKLHRTVHRPWGTYTTLEEGPGFKIKRVEVRPGRSMSLQLHNHRSEHWVVVTGTARIVNGEKNLDIRPNESTFIPVGTRHRMANPGTQDLVVIEVQTGGYLGEDDIVRFEDVYGRV
jgi:mannose-1-phosphate guanylyltransferase